MDRDFEREGGRTERRLPETKRFLKRLIEAGTRAETISLYFRARDKALLDVIALTIALTIVTCCVALGFFCCLLCVGSKRREVAERYALGCGERETLETFHAADATTARTQVASVF